MSGADCEGWSTGREFHLESMGERSTVWARHDDDVSLWQRYSGSHNKSTTKSYYNIRDNSNNHEDKKKEKKTGKKTVKKTVNKKEKNNDEHKLNKNRMIFL